MSLITVSSCIVIMIAVSVGGVLLFYRPLVTSTAWRATITPLASIMGSGFLICVPLLYANVGNFAVFAMAVLLCLAYAVGSVIRFNIRYGEPLLEKRQAPPDASQEDHRLHVSHRRVTQLVGAGNGVAFLERMSHVALAGAYCISVSYYLQLLAGFALHPLLLGKAWYGKALVTLILTGIGAMGLLRGLKGIERIERMVVGVNLASIAALIAGLLYYNIVTVVHGDWYLHATTLPTDRLHSIRLLMGMLIVVQGFETSRFLGSEHSREERIRTMKWAQLVSSGIYLVFLALMAVVIGGTSAGDQSGITAIVGYSRHVAAILPVLITITAIGSQFSAATADDAGCSGLLESTFGRWMRHRSEYLIVSVTSIGLTWITDVYQIISFASRAFACYYAVQCIVAFMVVKNVPTVHYSTLRLMAYGTLGIICAAVALFGIPAG